MTGRRTWYPRRNLLSGPRELATRPLYGIAVADRVDEFISTYSNEVAGIAKATRTLLKRLCPDAEEDLKLGWKTVSFASSTAFCAIAPHSKWVNLQFFNGANLSDPEQILEGTGKSMRHVKLRSKKDVSQKILADLILEAEKSAR